MTEPHEEHAVSTFALDVYVADGQRDPAIARHVADCGRCRAYVAELGVVAAEAPPRWSPPPRRRRAWLVTTLAAAAALTALLFALPKSDMTPDGYVGAKGSPAVQALVRGPAGAKIWDGRAPLHPGDAIALRAACEGFARVAVAVPTDHSRWQRVYESACPADAADAMPLPFTLVVDNEPGTERVAVVFSAKTLDDGDLGHAVDFKTRSAAAWVVPLAFAKSGANK